MTDEQKQSQLEGAIITALNAGGYLSNFGSDDEGEPEWAEPIKTAELWVEGELKNYIPNLAHDLLVLFGDRALTLISPVIVINYYQNNLTANSAEASSVAANFDLMQAMNGGGQ